MSDFRIDQITNQAGTAGPQIAGITTFSGSSGLLMPSGDTSRRDILDNIVTSGLTCYIDATNRDCYSGSGSTLTDLSIHRVKNDNITLFGDAEFIDREGGFFRLTGASNGNSLASSPGTAIASDFSTGGSASQGGASIDSTVAQTPKLDVSGFVVVRMGGNLGIGTFKHQVDEYTGSSQLISTRGDGSNECAYLILNSGSNGFTDSKGILRSVFSFDRYTPSGGSANTSKDENGVTFPFDGEWHFCAFSATHSSHVRFFIDGKWEQVAHTETFNGGNSTLITFGAQSSGGDFNRIITGDIAAAGLYSGRALSDGEIEQNYQVFKERYGI
jgi:hypothetical protein